MRKLELHIEGERNETVERYIFNQRKQNVGESIDNYLTDLRTLAATCNLCACMNVIASYQVSVMMKHGKNCYKKETWTW
jgi:hypothetical protein